MTGLMVSGLSPEEGSMLLCDCQTQDQANPFHALRWGSTWRMGGLKDPVRILCVCYQLIIPFDLEMPRCLFEQRWTREIVNVELWRHWENWWQSELLLEKLDLFSVIRPDNKIVN